MCLFMITLKILEFRTWNYQVGRKARDRRRGAHASKVKSGCFPGVGGWKRRIKDVRIRHDKIEASGA